MHDLTKQTAELIAIAKAEDLGTGDLTETLLPDARAKATFRMLAKEEGVFSGREVAAIILQAYDQSLAIEWTPAGQDGGLISNPPVELARIIGPLGSILAAERVLLNFLQRLSGVAALTHRFVEAVEGTRAVIYDTRKTIPGWRALDKYAVRCGGGCNHRAGLYDAVMIKDNHLTGVPVDRLAATVFDMLNRLEESGSRPAVTVEAKSVEEFKALTQVVGIDVILLDHFSLDQLRRAAEIRDDHGLRSRISLEASGGVNLNTVRAVAETGVDRISVGALTHSAPALDISLDRI